MVDLFVLVFLLSPDPLDVPLSFFPSHCQNLVLFPSQDVGEDEHILSDMTYLGPSGKKKPGSVDTSNLFSRPQEGQSAVIWVL